MMYNTLIVYIGWLQVYYKLGDSDVILYSRPCWRYTIVRSVLRHKRTYMPENFCSIYLYTG